MGKLDIIVGLTGESQIRSVIRKAILIAFIEWNPHGRKIILVDLADFDKRNTFDIEKFLSTRLKPELDEAYEVYDMDEEALKE